MAEKCAWFITLEEGNAAAQAAAAQLRPYGLPVKGQRWPNNEDNAWLASAQEAAQANAALVVVVGSAAHYSKSAVQRDLSMFRLTLQTLLGRVVNGLTLLAGQTESVQQTRPGLLDDWQPAADARWPVKAVARAYAPVAPAWPVKLGLHAHERLGIWLETHPAPGTTASGALVGVAGNDADISFHAVGAAGKLPERTVNEYALEGLKFNVDEVDFNAWAVQNKVGPNESYFVRLEGKPSYLALGTLPGGEVDDLHILRLG